MPVLPNTLARVGTRCPATSSLVRARNSASQIALERCRLAGKRRQQAQRLSVLTKHCHQTLRIEGARAGDPPLPAGVVKALVPTNDARWSCVHPSRSRAERKRSLGIPGGLAFTSNKHPLLKGCWLVWQWHWLADDTTWFNLSEYCFFAYTCV